MRLTLAEPKYLKESISIISELVSEASFKITKDAIEMVAMDPANVAMVIYKLLSSSFTEYDLPNDVEIAINLNHLKQILRRAKPNDMLTLELEEDNKLKIQFKSDTVRTFSIPIIELDEKEQKIPSLDFAVNIKMPSSMLNDAVEDVDIVGESVSFEAEAEKLAIFAEGDLSKAHININSNENIKIAVDGGAKIKSKYSIEYLKKIMQGGKLADEVSLSFNKDYPLKIEYKAIDKVMLSFLLAPRVEND